MKAVAVVADRTGTRPYPPALLGNIETLCRSTPSRALMTNRNVVKDEKAAPGAAAFAGPTRAMPEPNPAPPQPLPAPESEPRLLQSREPLDSPQPKPMIKQGKARGLKTG
jgi:hypothetical protein